MNYQIILDEKILGDFIQWLPELQEGECYYVVLLARNKYVRGLPNAATLPHIRSDKQQLARIVCHKRSLRDRIDQLQCARDSYRTRDGEPIPPEALALYITPNPRSHILATKAALKMMADYLTQPYNGYRLDQDVISCVQQACSRKVYLDFDFDGVDVEATLKLLEGKINLDCLTVLKTRGGFHVLVRLEDIGKDFKRSWYNALTALPGVDVKGDNLVPIPGCSQGMFTPHIVERTEQ